MLKVVANDSQSRHGLAAPTDQLPQNPTAGDIVDQTITSNQELSVSLCSPSTLVDDISGLRLRLPRLKMVV